MRAGGGLDKITQTEYFLPLQSERLHAEERKEEGIQMELSPKIREVVRYLGYHVVVPDEEVMREINDCIRDLQQVVTPRFVYERFPLSVREEADAVPLICIEDIQVRSRNLAKNLKKCCGVYLMAVTLGPGPDRLIKRASVSSMSKAVIYQAAAAAMTEEWCDRINERIRLEAEKDGLYLRPRYSPGYGDLPLEMQRDISRILNMPKEIGVSLTQSLLMTPSKSVTALIGVSKEPGECRSKGCEECEAADNCMYRA